MTGQQFTEDQLMFRETVERYAAAHRFDRPEGEHPDLSVVRDLGIWALPVPEDLGGLGGTALDVGIVQEAFGKNLVRVPFASHLAAVKFLSRFAETASSAELLTNAVNGTARPVLAHLERVARYCYSDIATTVIEEDGQLILNGSKTLVVDAAGATEFVVTARTLDNRFGAFIVASDCAGLTGTSYRLADGSTAWELTFDSVRLDKTQDASGGQDVLSELTETLTYVSLASCFEAIGIAEALMQLTLDHLRTRKQFGVTLGSFQAIQHQMAGVFLQLEAAKSLAMRAAAQNIDGMTGSERLCYAAKVLATAASLAVAERAVQYHGAIGITEELSVGRYLKRLHVLALQYGDIDWNLERYSDAPAGEDEDWGALGQDASFRAEVKAFLAENLTPQIRHAMHNATGIFIEKDIIDLWQQALLRKGWLTSTWPVEFGGPGWSPAQRYIFDRECALENAPLLPVQSLRLLAPVLHEFGSKDQQEYYLPKILSGEHFWCQGYSEPEAGSDLASLRTRAVRDGDVYVVNGTKIWTTNAHVSTHIFCLVRTAMEGKPQAGISFLMIPMETPGLSVRPIISTSGSHDLNQVFFDNVRVPVGNLVGAEGQGWTIAKFLLEHERGGSSYATGMLRDVRQIRIAASQIKTGQGAVLGNDHGFLRRLCRIEIDALAMESMEVEMVSRLARNERPGQQSAILALQMSQTMQAINRLRIEAYGHDALQLPAKHPLYGPEAGPAVGSEEARTAMPTYLNDLAWSIMGGSDEVMRNIISKTALVL